MVTLPDNPRTTPHLPLTTHSHQPRKPSPEVNASIFPPPTTCCTPLFSRNTTLRDRSTTIPTTAAASDAVDNEQTPAHSTSPHSDDTTTDSLSLFLHEWNISYNEFVRSSTDRTEITTSDFFDSDVVDADDDDPASTYAKFLSELDDLHNELTQLISSSSASPPCTKDTKNEPARDENDNTAHTTDERNNNDRDDNRSNNDNDSNNDDSNSGHAERSTDERIQHNHDNCTDNDRRDTNDNDNDNRSTDVRDHVDITAATKDTDASDHNDRDNIGRDNHDHDTGHCSTDNPVHTQRAQIEHKTDDCNKADSGNADRATNQRDNNDRSMTPACQPQYNQQSTLPTDHDNHQPNNDTSAIAERANDARVTTDHDNAKCTKSERDNDERNKADRGNEAQNTEKHDNGSHSPNTERQPHDRRQPTHPLATDHHPNNPHSHSDTRDTRAPEDATLRQLWIVLAQLEEINHQFALFLATLPIPQHSTTPSQPSSALPPGALTPNNFKILHDALPATSPRSGTLSNQMTDLNQPDNTRLPNLLLPSTTDPNPTGQLLLTKLPSGTQILTIRTPPWPPPMLQTVSPTPAIEWHNPGPVTNTRPVKQHTPNNTLKSPAYNPTTCPSLVISKHCTYKNYVRFKAPVFHQCRTLTKDFMRPP